jgi:hypothetical protein
MPDDVTVYVCMCRQVFDVAFGLVHFEFCDRVHFDFLPVSVMPWVL